MPVSPLGGTLAVQIDKEDWKAILQKDNQAQSLSHHKVIERTVRPSADVGFSQYLDNLFVLERDCELSERRGIPVNVFDIDNSKFDCIASS